VLTRAWDVADKQQAWLVCAGPYSQWRVSEVNRLTIHWRLSKTSDWTARSSNTCTHTHTHTHTRRLAVVNDATRIRLPGWSYLLCEGGRTSNWIAIDTRLELLSCKYRSVVGGHQSARTDTSNYRKGLEQSPCQDNTRTLPEIRLSRRIILEKNAWIQCLVNG